MLGMSSTTELFYTVSAFYTQELGHPQISGYDILKKIQMSENSNKALGLIRAHIGLSMITHKSCEIEQASCSVLSSCSPYSV